MEFIPVETETDSQQIKDQLDSLIVFFKIELNL